MFFKQENGKNAILIVYAEEIIITGDDIEEMERLEVLAIEVKDLGQMRYFLGMGWPDRGRGSASLNGNIFDLLTDMDMLGCKPRDAPIEAERRIEDVGKSVENERYHILFGKLIYLSHTRPEIAFAVSVVSQHINSPIEAHLAVYEILQYLKGSQGEGLLF